MVGVFLCLHDVAQGDAERRAKKKEIRECIIKTKNSRLNELSISNKLDWTKSLCLTLQFHFGGDWVVMIGHRAHYRSFHSVILEQNALENQMNDHMQTVQRVPLQINNKTDAEFMHFGMGTKSMNWSVVVAKIE